MEHVEVLRDLSEVCRAAIKAGDWKVDGACDPDAALRRADAAIASLSAPKRHERPKGNTPIDDLLAQYEADGCDYSDLDGVRRAARVYVKRMEGSQVRCLLHVLSAPKPDGLLPDELVPHAKEWYRLCERSPHASRLPVSGELAEAIVATVVRLNSTPPPRA